MIRRITTPRTVIYSGVVMYDGQDPIMFRQWATIDPGLGEEAVRGHMITSIVELYDGIDRNKIRVIELTWTDMDPVTILDAVPEMEHPETETELNEE